MDKEILELIDEIQWGHVTKKEAKARILKMIQAAYVKGVYSDPKKMA